MLSKQLPEILSNLAQVQQQSEALGFHCVVGALIIRKSINPENMSQDTVEDTVEDTVYVQKRSAHRSLFPNCWDILGGHVDTGEGLAEALAREIKEESGWTLSTIVKHLKTVEWKNNDGETMKEFVFLVSVEGDLDNPVLEKDKFSEFRWVSNTDLAILKENRLKSEQLIFELASLALENTSL